MGAHSWAKHMRIYEMKPLISWKRMKGGYVKLDFQLDRKYRKDPNMSRQEQLKNPLGWKIKVVEARRLTITLGSTNIVVREQICQAVHRVIAVKDFISTAVSGELHAALAWAGLMVILPVGCVH